MSGATTAMAIQGGGVGMSVMGSMNAATAQKNALNYQAQVAANNAVVAGYQAKIAEQVGENNVQSTQLRNAQVYGASRAAMAANGIDLGEGTATDVLTTDKYMGERDVLTIKDNTAQQVWAIKNQQANFASEASANASAARGISPFMAGATSLLTGAGSVSKSIYNYKKYGVVT